MALARVLVGIIQIGARLRLPCLLLRVWLPGM